MRSATVSALRPGTVVCGRYVVGVPIGPGRFTATDQVDGGQFEVAVLPGDLATDRSFLEDMLHEVRLSSWLDHPCVAAVRDWDREGDSVVVVSDPVDGVRLSDVVDRYRDVDPLTAHGIFDTLREALDHAHDAGVTHGDVSAEHVWLAPGGELRLAGFGLAGPLRRRERGAAERPPMQAEIAEDREALRRLLEQMLPATPEAQLVRPPPAPPELDWRRQARDVVARMSAYVPRRPSGMWPAVVAASVLLLVFAGLAGGVPGRVEVPRVAGMQAEEARNALTTLGLAVELQEVWAEAPEGTALGTLPEAGASLRRGERVELVLSRGPEPVALPSLVGLEASEAVAALEEAGFTVGERSEVFHDEVPAGAVVSQSPPTGSAPRGSAVDLVVSMGPELLDVPSVVNKTLEAARQAVTEAGFEVGNVTEAFHATVAKGAVVSQSPASGSHKRGTPVDLVVSKGQDLVAVPRTAGLGQTAARKAVSDAGLRWREVLEHSDSAAQGVVIRSMPGVGAQAVRGSTVTLVVSRGPQMVTMPNLVGMSRADARARVQSLGLVVEGEHAVPGSGRPSEEVVGQEPAAGSQVPRGTKVKIYYAP